MPSSTPSVSTIVEDIANSFRCGDLDTDEFGRAYETILRASKRKENKPSISAPTQEKRDGENRGGVSRPWFSAPFDPTEEYAILDEGGPPFPFRTIRLDEKSAD